MGLGASAAGSILQAGGAYTTAQGQKSALSYQASVANANAGIAAGMASDAIRAGQTAEETQYMKTGAVIGSQRAQLAANGVDLGEGNATDILSTTKLMGERDRLQIHDNAMMAAWGYTTQQQNYLSDARQAEAAAGAINPLLSAATSLLTSAGKVGTQWDAKAKVNGTADSGTAIGNKWNSIWKGK